MIRPKFTLFLFIPTLIFMTSCASIVSKSSYPVVINSQPDQADIVITDEHGKKVYRGKTPTTVSLKTSEGYFDGKNYTVTFTKDGYTSYTAPIKRGVDGWYIAGNIFLGGLIGYLIVDPLTGAMWTLEKEVNAVLSPLVSSEQDPSGLQIVSLADIPVHLRSQMREVRVP